MLEAAISRLWEQVYFYEDRLADIPRCDENAAWVKGITRKMKKHVVDVKYLERVLGGK